MWSLLVLGVGIATALGFAVVYESPKIAAWTLAVSAIATFFTLLLSLPPRGEITRDKTRTSITGTFIVAYFMLLGISVFYNVNPSDQGNQVGSALITNFTALMVTVIAFHFGSVAVEKVLESRETSRSPETREKTAAG